MISTLLHQALLKQQKQYSSFCSVQFIISATGHNNQYKMLHIYTCEMNIQNKIQIKAINQKSNLPQSNLVFKTIRRNANINKNWHRTKIQIFQKYLVLLKKTPWILRFLEAFFPQPNPQLKTYIFSPLLGGGLKSESNCIHLPQPSASQNASVNGQGF